MGRKEVSLVQQWLSSESLSSYTSFAHFTLSFFFPFSVHLPYPLSAQLTPCASHFHTPSNQAICAHGFPSPVSVPPAVTDGSSLSIPSNSRRDLIFTLPPPTTGHFVGHLECPVHPFAFTGRNLLSFTVAGEQGQELLGKRSSELEGCINNFSHNCDQIFGSKQPERGRNSFRSWFEGIQTPMMEKELALRKQGG